MARAGAKRSTRKLKIARSLGVNLWGQAKSPFNKRKYKP
ncbi:MAG: 30S ribosomal protein S4, partial [Alphaproteobacteria bacterium]|nr:30S ribosomal protein S4 [Alphaproteobacteria bacterium]